MGKGPFPRGGLHGTEQLADAPPLDPRAVHPRLDGQVPRPSTGFVPGHDHFRAPESRRDAQTHRVPDIPAKDRGEDHDPPSNPRASQLLGLVQGRHAEPPRIQRLQCPRNRDRAEPVGIGLDHRKER